MRAQRSMFSNVAWLQSACCADAAFANMEWLSPTVSTLGESTLYAVCSVAISTCTELCIPQPPFVSVDYGVTYNSEACSECISRYCTLWKRDVKCRYFEIYEKRNLHAGVGETT